MRVSAGFFQSIVAVGGGAVKQAIPKIIADNGQVLAKHPSSFIFILGKADLAGEDRLG